MGKLPQVREGPVLVGAGPGPCAPAPAQRAENRAQCGRQAEWIEAPLCISLVIWDNSFGPSGIRRVPFLHGPSLRARGHTQQREFPVPLPPRPDMTGPAPAPGAPRRRGYPMGPGVRVRAPPSTGRCGCH